MDAVRSFLKRHAPDLVAVVEALGKEASGTFSELAIAEIDEDKYFIDEYSEFFYLQVLNIDYNYLIN